MKCIYGDYPTCPYCNNGDCMMEDDYEPCVMDDEEESD